MDENDIGEAGQNRKLPRGRDHLAREAVIRIGRQGRNLVENHGAEAQRRIRASGSGIEKLGSVSGAAQHVSRIISRKQDRTC